jgi:hypothetical protein
MAVVSIAVGSIARPFCIAQMVRDDGVARGQDADRMRLAFSDLA